MGGLCRKMSQFDWLIVAYEQDRFDDKDRKGMG